MYHQFGAVLVFVLLGAAFVAGNLLLGALIRLARKGGAKETVYECGEPTIGSAWVRYNSRFYNIALVFLLFDVEVVVLIPAMLVMRELAADGYGLAAFWALFIFLALLVLGLAYEWLYGNLDWIKREEQSTPS